MEYLQVANSVLEAIGVFLASIPGMIRSIVGEDFRSLALSGLVSGLISGSIAWLLMRARLLRTTRLLGIEAERLRSHNELLLRSLQAAGWIEYSKDQYGQPRITWIAPPRPPADTANPGHDLKDEQAAKLLEELQEFSKELSESSRSPS